MLRLASALVLACSLATAGTGDRNHIVIATFDAGWCTSCTGGHDTAAQVTARLPGVRSVRFDVSTPEARAASARLAADLGLARIYENHRLKPGVYAIATQLRPMQAIVLDESRPVAELVALLEQAAAEPATAAADPHFGS